MAKTLQDKRLKLVVGKLIRASGKTVFSKVGVYAELAPFVLKMLGKESYSGHPKKLFIDNIEALEESLKTVLNNQPKTQKKRVRQKPRISLKVTSNDFLSSYEWRVLRMQALKKYGPVCMCCGDTPKNGAIMNVDHIKPRRFYPELALDINNLQILCSPCNHGKGNWDTTDWRATQDQPTKRS